tara:strand:- start:1303 stop:1602 length:300 start_codon:yes stop_codon:yes gene_type:complete
MELLNVNGKTLYYKIIYDYDEVNGETAKTKFYLTNNVFKNVKKYRFFGPRITVPNDKVVFTLGYDIESVNRTKGMVRKDIERKVELLGREEEIANGEII